MKSFANPSKRIEAGCVFGGVFLLGLLTGCAGQIQSAQRVRIDAPPPPDVYVDVAFPVQDDYVYYPKYQVYYSNYRREYVYLDRGTWVSRPAPPRAARKVLSSSHSVKLDFRDSPSLHHSEVVQEYPKDWAPDGHEKEGGNDDKGNGRGHK